MNPVISSIIGYCIEILKLQFAHFPFWIKKEIIGIFLYIGIGVLQWKQKDLGKIIDNFLGNLKIITFMKLPYIAPNINIITGMINCIFYYCANAAPKLNIGR